MPNALSILRRWGLSGLLGGLLACRPAPSDSELLRLYLLDDELMGLNDKVGKAQEGSVKSIEAQVTKNQNQPADLAVLQQSRAVRAETRQLVAYLRGLRQQLSPAGKVPTLQQLAGHQMVAEVLLDGGQADSLQRHLSRYVALMRPYLGRRSEPGPGIGEVDERVQVIAGAQRAGLSFTNFYFRDATLAEALAALAQQESYVLQLEASVLHELSQRVGAPVLLFDRINTFASAESNVVAEGETYRAELFLTASASGIQPKMTCDGQPLPVGPDGKGRVTFTAPPLPPGQRRQTATWVGTLTMRTNGRDTTFRLRVPYTIVRRR